MELHLDCTGTVQNLSRMTSLVHIRRLFPRPGASTHRHVMRSETTLEPVLVALIVHSTAQWHLPVVALKRCCLTPSTFCCQQ
jgi:hypothetical protein